MFVIFEGGGGSGPSVPPRDPHILKQPARKIRLIGVLLMIYMSVLNDQTYIVNDNFHLVCRSFMSCFKSRV